MLNRDLKSISMCEFIKMFRCGADSYDQKTACILMDRFFEITGKLSVKNELEKRSNALSCLMVIKSMEICKNLFRFGGYSDICEVFKNLGYRNIDVRDHKRIFAFIEDIERKNKSEYASLLRRKGRPNLQIAYPDYFDSDTPIVCERFKVDSVDDWSAQKYAEHVKILCDELKNWDLNSKRKV